MKKLLLVPLALIFMLGLAPSCKHNPYIPDGILIVDSTDLTQPCDPNVVYFINQVQPILVSNCAKPGCHDANTRAEDIDYSSYQSTIQSETVEPGRPNNSKLYEIIIKTDPNDVMPPSGNTPLTADQKDLIYMWILQGALNNGCTENTCDTANQTLSANVQPILSTYCYGCHSSTAASGSGAGINLETYSNLQTSVVDGKLMCSINHGASCSAMPKGGAKLPQCQIDKIQSWVNAGALNN
jgi:uncharacterized membrane protein